MRTYRTFDELPDLTTADMASAFPLTLAKLAPGDLMALMNYDNGAKYSTSGSAMWQDEIFSFTGTMGATYGVFSNSFFDPAVEVYDSHGNVIAIDSGSAVYGTGLASFRAPYTGTFYASAGWSQGYADAHKYASISVYEDVNTVAKKNVVTGTAGADTIPGTSNLDIVDGGAGTDTFVLGLYRAYYTVSVGDGTVTVTNPDDYNTGDLLQGIERIRFSDGVLSFEMQGAAAESYRLYQAAFDRAPDAKGLGYWINARAQGESLHSMAQAFTASAEFARLYGASPSNDDVLTKVYQNVLHRAPDKAGFDYWLHLLDNHAITTADMLASFSESPENQAQVSDAMHAGYFFAF